MRGTSLFGAVLAALSLASGAMGQAAKNAAKAAPVKAGAVAPKVVVKRDNPCSVLLPNEVGQILGRPITMREVVDEVTCHFDYDDAKQGEPPYFEMKVHYRDGRTVVATTRMAGKLLGPDAGFEKLAGIGDEAWMAPFGALLVFRKGDAGVELDLRLVPKARERGITLAKLVAARLASAGF